MSREIINLLPRERLSAFRRSYFIRLATVGVLLLSALVISNGIFLLPSYLYLAGEVRSQQQALATLDSNVTPETQAVISKLGALKADAVYLTRLKTQPSASEALRAVLAIPRSGITLSSIAFTPATAVGGKGTMTLTGRAATREDLRAYDLALSSTSFIASVGLPISVYAKESDIDFTMTLTGPLTP